MTFDLLLCRPAFTAAYFAFTSEEGQEVKRSYNYPFAGRIYLMQQNQDDKQPSEDRPGLTDLLN